VRNCNFISVRLEKNSDSVLNEYGSVWFEKLSSGLILQLFNTRVVNLQQILQYYK